MRTPKQRLQGAIEFIVDTAVDGVASRPEDAPDTVRDVAQYLFRVWEQPDSGRDWEFELRGAICCANHLLPGSVDDIRRLLAHAVHRALHSHGLLRHQRKAA